MDRDTNVAYRGYFYHSKEVNCAYLKASRTLWPLSQFGSLTQKLRKSSREEENDVWDEKGETRPVDHAK
jgi:hypothetical protein